MGMPIASVLWMSKGKFVDSHRIFSILLKYLVEQKGMTGEVVKSFSVTQMVDQQCEKVRSDACTRWRSASSISAA